MTPATKPLPRTLTRVYAASGPCPVALTGPTPDTVRWWVQELRDRWEEHGQYLTVSALCLWARNSLQGVDSDLAVCLIRQEFADEYAAEREVNRSIIRGAYVRESKPAKEYAGPRLADTVPAATGSESQPVPTVPPAPVAASGRGATILGVPATGVVRWMGSKGWDAERACRVVASFGVDLAVSTVRTQLGAGAKNERGGPAQLTPEQVQELERR
jgi:hypothetical protein